MVNKFQVMRLLNGMEFVSGIRLMRLYRTLFLIGGEKLK